MEEEVLLNMYRNTWDAFLEAYKVKMDQNKALIELCADTIDALPKTKTTKFKERLGRVLEV